jgi:hypothetical protein
MPTTAPCTEVLAGQECQASLLLERLNRMQATLPCPLHQASPEKPTNPTIRSWLGCRSRVRPVWASWVGEAGEMGSSGETG